MISTILSTLGIIGIIGIGIWVGTIQTKVSTVGTMCGTMSAKLDKLVEDVAFIKGMAKEAVR